METVDKFTGPFMFLSNFYMSKGISVEHVYQASKTFNLDWVHRILQAPGPADAKALGRKCPLREDWDEIKLTVMETLLLIKFSDPELRQRLMETRGMELIEGNNWGDKYWGMVYDDGLLQGQNHLGKLLMKIRDANL